MKSLAAVLALAALGCASIRSDYLASDVEEVNRLAFDGKITAAVRYCDRYDTSTCWRHHGLFVPATNRIHIAPEWYWEPHIYHLGIVAHEMIHAKLHAERKEAGQAHPHSYLFRQERERVAQAIGIPVWAIPDGRRYDKIDSTRLMAHVERTYEAMILRTRGVPYRYSGDAGWPTELYDPDE